MRAPVRHPGLQITHSSYHQLSVFYTFLVRYLIEERSCSG